MTKDETKAVFELKGMMTALRGAAQNSKAIQAILDEMDKKMDEIIALPDEPKTIERIIERVPWWSTTTTTPLVYTTDSTKTIPDHVTITCNDVLNGAYSSVSDLMESLK